MNRIFLLALSMFASSAFATDWKSPRNRTSGGNLCEQVNIGGTLTDVLCFTGAAGAATMKGPLTLDTLQAGNVSNDLTLKTGSNASAGIVFQTGTGPATTATLGNSITVPRFSVTSSSANASAFFAEVNGTTEINIGGLASTSDVPVKLYSDGIIRMTIDGANGLVTFANGYKGNQPIAVHCTIATTSGSTGSCSARTEDSMPSYATSAQSGGGAATNSGLLTVTINRTGYYMACQSSAITASSTYTTAFQIANVWGGTGTLYGQNRDIYAAVSAPNDNSTSGCRVYNITSGQTITMSTTFLATATSPTGQAAYQIIAL